MKKVFITPVLALVILMAFSSCRKCVICTKDSEPEVRICEDDYGSNTQYGLAVDGYELIGYTCK